MYCSPHSRTWNNILQASFTINKKHPFIQVHSSCFLVLCCDLVPVHLTQWGWDKMAAILQTTFSNAFSWMKITISLLEFHWNMFPGVQLSICHHWFRWWLGAKKVTGHYLNQWQPSILMHIWVTQPQWIDQSLQGYLCHWHSGNHDFKYHLNLQKSRPLLSQTLKSGGQFSMSTDALHLYNARPSADIALTQWPMGEFWS